MISKQCVCFLSSVVRTSPLSLATSVGVKAIFLFESSGCSNFDMHKSSGAYKIVSISSIKIVYFEANKRKMLPNKNVNIHVDTM